MVDWSKVVTNPLGLVGFVLFLVFPIVGKVIKDERNRWVMPTAFIFAGIALLGGIGIAYRQAVARSVSTQVPAVQPVINAPTKSNCEQQNNAVTQHSSGEGSPNVINVCGDVTISQDFSKGKNQAK